jgi:hypothetical protein
MIDLSKCTMREVAHFNGGKEWFGYRHRCNEHPRLTRMDKYIRKTRAVESTFHVDGKQVASLEAAAELLAVPYLPTTDEVELLRLVPDEYARLDERVRFVRLKDVGLVEFKDGDCRRTDAGRAALLQPETEPKL